MQSAFSIKDSLRFGFEMTKKNFGFLFLLTLGVFVINAAFAIAQKDEANVVLSTINVVVNFFAMFTFVRAVLVVYTGGAPHARDIFAVDWPLFGMYCLGTLVSTLVTVIGLALLVIPGIVLGIRLGFAGFALVDEKVGPLGSLRRSWELTRGRFWHLLLFSLALIGVNIVGTLVLGIGLLVTSPLCLVSMAYVYQKLKASAPLKIEPVAMPA